MFNKRWHFLLMISLLPLLDPVNNQSISIIFALLERD